MTEEERGDVVRSNGEVGTDGDNLEDGKNVEDEGESVKLFVGQVPKHMTEEDLVGMFKEVAIVDEVNIIKDKVTRASRGCCFLILPSRVEADKAVEACHNKKTLPGASSPLQVKYADGELERLEHKLFVGMLPKNVTESELTTLFLHYGNIKDLQILRGSQQTSKGCAFLKYETKEQAHAALEALNGKHKMEGSTVPLVVKWADTEKERQARRAQKTQSQISSISDTTAHQPSIFGALPMGFVPSYNGFSYQTPGYGLMQYPLQNQQFQNISPQLNQPNPFRGINPTISPSVAARTFAALQSAAYVASSYPSMQGLQYPVTYSANVLNQRSLSSTVLSHGSSGQPPMFINKSPTPVNIGPTSAGGQIEGPPGANLFIYHIPQEYGDQDLSNAFQPFGRVLSTKVYVDRATGISKCFGFVSYESPESAIAAISMMNGYQLGGKKLKVQLKRDNKQNKSY
ncbi:putative RNA binding protein [Zostera marina]|uniref:Putative RNA binding protein n=1 Tax=Zostera marina TaxID=29655 RepID=A0A0K9Q1K5_ZOSMR|nr:putative RNA binding protein [Zostera marina]